MAKFAAILGLLRGKISANVFSHNKGGDYVRKLSTPTNPNSTRQQTVRSILSTLSAAFSGLTSTQKEAWGTWADANPRKDPLGNNYTLTGHQAYVGINARLSDAGLTLLDDPPDEVAPTELVVPTVTISAATSASVAFTGTAPTGSVLVLWMSQPQNGAGDPNIDQCTLVGYSSANPTTPTVFTLPMSVQSGQTVNFYCAFMSTVGLLGVLEKDQATRA